VHSGEISKTNKVFSWPNLRSLSVLAGLRPYPMLYESSVNSSSLSGLRF